MDTTHLRAAATIFLLGTDPILRHRHEIDEEIMSTAVSLMEARPEGARNMYLRLSSKLLILDALKASRGEPTIHQQEVIDDARLKMEEIQLERLREMEEARKAAAVAARKKAEVAELAAAAAAAAAVERVSAAVGQPGSATGTGVGVDQAVLPTPPALPGVGEEMQSGPGPAEQLQQLPPGALGTAHNGQQGTPPGYYFDSHEAAYEGLLAIARAAGYGVTCSASEYDKKTEPKKLRTAIYKCDRGSYVYKEMPEEMKKRKRTSRQTGCPFRATISRLKMHLGVHADWGMKQGQWVLTLQVTEHNHAMSTTPADHACHRKLTQHQKDIIAACIDQGMGPSKIARHLAEEAQKAGVQLYMRPKNIVNEVRKIRKMKETAAAGGTPPAEGMTPSEAGTEGTGDVTMEA